MYTYRVFPAFLEQRNVFGIPAEINANSQGAALPGAAESVRAEASGQNACAVKWVEPADHGGHPVRGYLIQVALDVNGNPGTFVTINPDAVDDPFTVMGAETMTFTYTGLEAQRGATAGPDTLTARSPRWFRVIPVTNENDGDQTTGGAVLKEDGTENTPRNGRVLNGVAGLPLPDDTERAVRAVCTTEALGDAPADTVTADPQMPVDLTAEAASDTNALGDGDRGVFLTWNEQPVGDASKTTAYVINRVRMNTGVAALNDEPDEDGELPWKFVTRVSDVTSYTDSTDLRRDEETRMYEVCSEARGVGDPVCVTMPVDYALHDDMHKPSAPQMVTATADSATEVTVNWMTPADDGGSDITGFTIRVEGESGTMEYTAFDMMMAMATRRHRCTR